MWQEVWGGRCERVPLTRARALLLGLSSLLGAHAGIPH